MLSRSFVTMQQLRVNYIVMEENVTTWLFELIQSVINISIVGFDFSPDYSL